MAYCFTFDTESAYLAAKASGGVIYNDLYVTSDGKLSRSAISFCKDTYQLYTDSINLIVDRERGEIGDCLLYNTNTSKYYWLKNTNSWSTSSKGSCIANNSELSAAGYIKIGYMVPGFGKDVLIVSCDDLGTSKFTTSYISSTPTNYAIINGGSQDTNISLSLKLAEKTYGNNPTKNGIWKVSRYYWDLLKNAELTMTSYNKTVNYATYYTRGSWSRNSSNYEYYSNYGGYINVGVFDEVPNTSTNNNYQQYRLYDYNYDFDLFYNTTMVPQIGSSNVMSTTQMEGSNATARVYTHLAPSTCYNYSISNVPDFGSKKWWLPSLAEYKMIMDNLDTLQTKGFSINNSTYWTSNIHSNKIWVVNFNDGSATTTSYSNSYKIRAISSFTI